MIRIGALFKDHCDETSKWGNAIFEPGPDGSLRVRNPTELGPYPDRLIERLQYWAAAAPDRVLLASRDGEGWRKIIYREALNLGSVP
jgi:feruloyl-CoA synthase